MRKLAFIGNSESPSTLFNMWKRQTPGCTGRWGNLQAIDNYGDADCFAVIDRLPGNVHVDPKKCVFLGAHPETLPHIYADMTNLTCLAKADCKYTPGFLEWWINFDYDTLKALKPPEKTRRLGCIMSNNETNPSHTARLRWLSRFAMEKAPSDFDLHGRIKPRSTEMANYYRGRCGEWDGRPGGGHMQGKEDVYLTHKYMIEFDVMGEHYFSERILDSLLLWALPVYYGCPNLQKYIPENSFRRLDVNGCGEDVLSLVNSNFYEEHTDDIARARTILLDELQLFPRIHNLIFGTFR